MRVLKARFVVDEVEVSMTDSTCLAVFVTSLNVLFDRTIVLSLRIADKMDVIFSPVFAEMSDGSSVNLSITVTTAVYQGLERAFIGLLEVTVLPEITVLKFTICNNN